MMRTTRRLAAAAAAGTLALGLMTGAVSGVAVAAPDGQDRIAQSRPHEKERVAARKSEKERTSARKSEKERTSARKSEKERVAARKHSEKERTVRS